MLFIRSFLFIICAFIVTTLELVICAPVFFLIARKKAWNVPKFWVHSMNFLMRYLAGVSYKIEGLENIPQHGAFIVAPKHQSTWDSYSFLPFIDDPIMILKKSLMYIPLFGWYMKRVGAIPIRRGSPIQAMRAVIKDAKIAAQDQRQILIFPEGTRRTPGADPAYKPGILSLYNELDIPVVIIAHNAGLYWPKNRFLLYPGTIHCRVLPPIQPGLAKKEFFEQLIQQTEDNVTQLLLQAAQSDNPPPMPLEAIKTLREHGINWLGKTRPS